MPVNLVFALCVPAKWAACSSTAQKKASLHNWPLCGDLSGPRCAPAQHRQLLQPAAAFRPFRKKVVCRSYAQTSFGSELPLAADGGTYRFPSALHAAQARPRCKRIWPNKRQRYLTYTLRRIHGKAQGVTPKRQLFWSNKQFWGWRLRQGGKPVV